MLEAIEKGQIEQGSTIIIESLDRLSRQGIDVTQQIIKSILQHNSLSLRWSMVYYWTKNPSTTS